MKILTRYVVFQHFLPVITLALSALVGLYLIIDFFEKIDNFMEKNVPLMDAFSYFIYKVPFIVVQGIPMAALLAALIGIGILKRNREIVALEAAGIKPSLYTGPIIVTAVILSIIHFGIGETLARYANFKAEQIWEQQVKNKKPSATWIQENIWYKGQDVIYQARIYNSSKQTLEKVTVFYFDPQFRLIQRLDAKHLHWDGSTWIAENGLSLRFNGSQVQEQSFYRLPLNLAETPSDFEGLGTTPEEMDWFSLYRYIQKIQQEGYDTAPYQVELNTRAASPCTTFILVILGIAIALRQGHHAGIALSIGVALACASIYFAVLQTGSSLAMAGVLPPLVGVWSGNIIFAALAFYLGKR